MKRAEDFRRAMGPVEEGFDAAVRRTLGELQVKEDTKVKKKMSVGLVLAAAIVLVTVTAMAAGNNWSVLLERLLGTSDAPEAAWLVQAGESELCGNDDVRFVVREKLYDGYGLYLAVDVFPAKEDVLLLGWDGHMEREVRPDSPAAVLGVEQAENMTVAQYCQKNGLRMVQAYATYYSPALKDSSPVTQHSMICNLDGSLTFVLTSTFTGDPADLGIQCVSIAIDSDMNGAVWYENVPLHITLAEDAVREEKCWTGPVLAAQEADLRLEHLRAVRTPIGCYLDLAWSTNDETPEWLQMPDSMAHLHYFCLTQPSDDPGRRPFGVESTPDKQSPAGRHGYHTVWPLDPDKPLPDTVSIDVMRSTTMQGVLMGEKQGSYTLELK